MADEDDNKYGMDFRIWKGDNNKPGQSGNAEPAREIKQRPQDPPLPPAQPKPKELKFLKGKIEPGKVAGFKLNQKCIVTGTAEWQDNARVSKIDTSLFITVPGHPEEDMLSHGTGTIEKDGSFTADVMLYCAKAYEYQDNKDKLIDKVTYRYEITHPNHIEPISITIDFPLESDTEPPILKRGNYDDAGSAKYPDKCPKSGENYLAGTPVQDWQKVLIKARYLPPKSDDGVFGEATEKATIQFQRDSFLKKRLNQPTQKFEDAPITFQGKDDGIVGPKTRNEMGIWDRSKWIQPIFEIHPDHFDGKHSLNGGGSRQDTNFVENNLVCEIQRNMQKIGSYQGYTIDGWAGPKWKDCIKEIQDAGKKGEWLLNGQKVTIPYRLENYRPGVADVETQKLVAHVLDQGLKLPVNSGKNIFPLPANIRDKGYHTGARAFGASRNNGTRSHAGCDLYAPIGTEVHAVADGKVIKYYNFYGQTYALEIQHGDQIIRYGEIQPPADNIYGNDAPPASNCRGLASGIQIGGLVTKGQHIGYVGRLRLKNEKTGKLDDYHESMVHFELFSGKMHGDLTNKANGEYLLVPKKAYQRRSDLTDPTKFLDECDNL